MALFGSLPANPFFPRALGILGLIFALMGWFSNSGPSFGLFLMAFPWLLYPLTVLFGFGEQPRRSDGRAGNSGFVGDSGGSYSDGGGGGDCGGGGGGGGDG